ncbi:hypothetical protein [uncultured Tenacibaculum sp.]|uniref:hypothetical protein n=1 Tax=uncultured Tenacibaculum sp. TaxID=174713 RepID=UPI002615DCC7|nr:hypothetical protein [uncultured Tenacibaculum sp.]
MNYKRIAVPVGEATKGTLKWNPAVRLNNVTIPVYHDGKLVLFDTQKEALEY